MKKRTAARARRTPAASTRPTAAPRRKGQGTTSGGTPRGGSRNSRPESPKEALLKAAITLFGKRGPAAVSTRELAAAANVNNGLIHRHFRTKDELLRETMDRLAREIADAGGPADGDVGVLFQFLNATQERSAYWRLLARSILDGKHPRDLQTDFPTGRKIVDAFRHLQEKGLLSREFDPQILAAAMTAAALGWFIFEPFLILAADLSDRDRGEVRRMVRHTVLLLLERAG